MWFLTWAISASFFRDPSLGMLNELSDPEISAGSLRYQMFPQFCSIFTELRSEFGESVSCWWLPNVWGGQVGHGLNHLVILKGWWLQYWFPWGFREGNKVLNPIPFGVYISIPGKHRKVQFFKATVGSLGSKVDGKLTATCFPGYKLRIPIGFLWFRHGPFSWWILLTLYVFDRNKHRCVEKFLLRKRSLPNWRAGRMVNTPSHLTWGCGTPGPLPNGLNLNGL